MTEAKTQTAGVIAPPPLIFLGALILAVALDWWVVRTQGLDMPASLRWTVVPLLLLAGIALIAAAMGQFRRAGTPAPPWQPTTAFVARGVYRFTRNPMYLGMTLIYLALGIAADAPVIFWLLIPLVLTVQYGVIAREERYMAAKFGTPYVDYFHTVPRWL
ncbi:MAG: isoprenylcysteine carboxyl methyltransferase [Alphaproteobacteria bacterium HGW-Alphaproteobacteria-16]|nr:MAG: isoprenylcysteine carboxyl methyltransferase [Alphaproteobacteria bacterium HGW-Alphaproteobacteria-16]